MNRRKDATTLRTAPSQADSGQRYAAPRFTIARYRWTRFWAVTDAAGELICLCVYRKGARALIRRFEALSSPLQTRPTRSIQPTRGES